MSTIITLVCVVIIGAASAYFRIRLWQWSLATIATILAVGFGFAAHIPMWVMLGIFVIVFALPLNVVPLRRRLLSARLLAFFRRVLPQLSETEQVALDAGTVGFEGELFSGKPDWSQLLSEPRTQLTAEEQAFLDGPCEKLCAMIDDWHITHEIADLPPEVWEFIKREGFFGMIIPKRYGGKEYSATAHSDVLQKLASVTATLSSIVAVPNSLGPAELLLRYGNEEQKNHYLPRLARGEDIPCFALTGPRVGSDAAAIPDTGVVCRGLWQGREIVGLKLNFSKRYITLAPIATVIGLAFRM
ncbi:MAG: acyl-CoA dehydrogenase family protein, partial [Rhodanobacteraceae bacterium]